MTKPAIKVEGLWKEYTVGQSRDQHNTFYDFLSSSLKAPVKRLRKLRGRADESEKFWALRDINLEVQPGEVLGIIGRNGAGKSTLLKILSRITAPTRGRIEVCGRLASLLEVGTGFHPELSGRENIYLNGAILGMTRREVTSKFDEIVAFAEIEKFIDTPVKHYSSGMYVRLAFAVAAHLEPDILLVDEVLAVGDAEFQKRCLGKIGEVASVGRTILLVSHNMQAIQSLCNRCLLLNKGKNVLSGQPETVISEYLHSENTHIDTQWTDMDGLGDKNIRLRRISVYAESGERGATTFFSKNDLYIELDIILNKNMSGLCVGLDLLAEHGECVFRSYDTDVPSEQYTSLRIGHNVLCCRIPKGLLNAGRYSVAPRIGIHNQEWIVHSDPLVRFTITLTHGESPFWNVLHETNRPGVIAPILTWFMHAVEIPKP